MTPDVSILLVTRNGIATLPALLGAIASQQSDFLTETVAVDSGSTDGTRELLRHAVDRVFDVSQSSFNHGLTRNFGIERCRGRLVVLLVQDALPASPQWLAELVRPLMADQRLAGTYARQVPRDDASAITRHYHALWAAASPSPRVTYVSTPAAFERLAPMDRFMACVFDNVCSCVRRSVWEQLPFKETRIAEDVEWAKDVLLAGHGLAYVPASVVVHSHDRSAGYELRRTYLVHQRLRKLFGLATVPNLACLIRAVATSVPLHVGCVMRTWRFDRSPRELVRGLGLAVTMPLGQYLGIRAADTGREWLHSKGI
jgi:rhamnosyltransferase